MPSANWGTKVPGWLFARNANGQNFPLSGGVQAACDSSVSYIKLEQWHQEGLKSAGRNRLGCFPLTDDGHRSPAFPSP